MSNLIICTKRDPDSGRFLLIRPNQSHLTNTDRPKYRHRNIIERIFMYESRYAVSKKQTFSYHKVCPLGWQAQVYSIYSYAIVSLYSLAAVDIMS